MRLPPQRPVTPPAPPLKVGERVKLAPDTRRWWRVQAVSENFVACVRQAEFQKKGTLCYTVLDWRSGVRGPCNLVGQGWGDGSYSEAECQELLAGFEAFGTVAHALAEAPPGKLVTYDVVELEVSHRNRVPLDVLARAGG